MTKPTLLGMSGSLRSASFNRLLLCEAARLFGEANFIEADLRLPLYDGDLEEAQGIPASVQKLADQIALADAVIIATPEYNKGISGAMKNALDWVSRTQPNPWFGKPVAIMSATAGRAGGERAQVMLRNCMVAFRPRILQGPEMLLAQTSTEFDAHGQLKSHLYVLTLTELMLALRAEIDRQ